MRTLSRFCQIGALAIVVLASQASAQPRHAETTAAGAAQLESALQANPHDLSARRALLEYYFTARIDAAAAIAARRRHILWVIENAPDQQLAYGPEMTIDPAGHALADAKGFELASSAWRAQAAKTDAKSMTLANAAYFFKTSDMAYTISLLQHALRLDAANKEIAARLGDEYALAILGVTMVNRSGYPTRNDQALARSSLAADCRKAVAETRNPYVLAKAGYQLLWQGDILYYSGKLPFDPEPLAKTALDRAVSLAPSDRDIAALSAQYDQIREARGLTPSAVSTRRTPVNPDRTQAALPAPPAALPRTQQVSAADLKQVSNGMSREQLLKLGAPSSRMTMDEDGHLIEVFQYSADGEPIGTIHLTDGAVSAIRLR